MKQTGSRKIVDATIDGSDCAIHDTTLLPNDNNDIISDNTGNNCN